MKLPSVVAWLIVGTTALLAGASDVRHAYQELRAFRTVQDRSKMVTLRICNAYPFSKALDVFLLSNSAAQHIGEPQSENLSPFVGLAYKDCTEVSRALQPGNELDFTIGGDHHVGIFKISDVPADGSLLQVVVYRSDQLTTAAGFSSHVFRDTQDPQVVLIDTSKGLGSSSLELREFTEGKPQTVTFDKVVTITPGLYEWVLKTDKHQDDRFTLQAVRGQNYVVMRMGVEAFDGPSFPQEMVIYPSFPITFPDFRAAAERVGSVLVVAWSVVAIVVLANL